MLFRSTNGSHNLFSFDKQTVLYIENPDITSSINQLNYYMGFKAYNCKFTITRMATNLLSNYTLDITDDYSQDIIHPVENTSYIYNVSISEKTNNDSKCFLGAYSYVLRNKKLSDNSTNVAQEILLMDNVPQKFIFNENFNYMRFVYPNTEIKDDLEIDIKNPNNAKFTIRVFFNDIYNGTEYNWASDNNAIITKAKWRGICIHKAFICAVSFDVFNGARGDIMFEIKAKTKHKYHFHRNRFLIFLIIVISIVVFLAVSLITIFVCKIKTKNQKMIKEVNAISFQEEDREREGNREYKII